MPFELIVQTPFTERLENNRVRIRHAGEHIFDPAEVETVKAAYGASVVQVWVDEATKPAPAPEPDDKAAEPESKPADEAAKSAATPEHPAASAPDAH